MSSKLTMAKAIHKVIVVGAGGTLGRSVLEALRADATFTVSVLSRKSSSSVFPADVVAHRIDDTYPIDQLSRAFSGQDAVVSAINPSGNALQQKMIDIALNTGVTRFIPAEFGGNGKHPGALELLPMFIGKKEIVDYLCQKESTGLTWTALCTGPFFDWGMKRGLLGFDLESRAATTYDSGDSRWSTTTLKTIGLAVARVLHHSEDTANQYVFIQSISTSQNEILAALQKEAGGGSWKITHSTIKDAAQSGQAKLKEGNWSGIGELLLATIFSDKRGNDFARTETLANSKLELPEDNLQDIIHSACRAVQATKMTSAWPMLGKKLCPEVLSDVRLVALPQHKVYKWR